MTHLLRNLLRWLERHERRAHAQNLAARLDTVLASQDENEMATIERLLKEGAVSED